jgi:hypothetical protein
MNAASTRPGSTRVARAGFGVAPSRTFSKTQPGDGTHYSRRRLPHFVKPWVIYAVTISTKKNRCLSPNVRTVVLNSLRHFHNQRCEMSAACVMPDHVHLLLRNPWDSRVAGQNQDYPWVWTHKDEYRKESLFRRDAETSTRDACATQRREP